MASAGWLRKNSPPAAIVAALRIKSLLDDLIKVVPSSPSFSNWSPVVLCLVAGMLLLVMLGIRNPLQLLVTATMRIPDRTETILSCLRYWRNKEQNGSEGVGRCVS